MEDGGVNGWGQDNALRGAGFSSHEKIKVRLVSNNLCLSLTKQIDINHVFERLSEVTLYSMWLESEGHEELKLNKNRFFYFRATRKMKILWAWKHVFHQRNNVRYCSMEWVVKYKWLGCVTQQALKQHPPQCHLSNRFSTYFGFQNSVWIKLSQHV